MSHSTGMALQSRSRLIALAVAAALAKSQLGFAAPEPADSAARDSGVMQLEEVIVTGMKLDYKLVEGANKLPLEIKDTPISVKVLTSDMLKFAGIEKFSEVYKVDAGSLTTHQQDGWTETYFRGYHITGGGGIKIDGFSASGSIEFDTAPYERVELIKGTNATLYGYIPIGGLISAVTKKPQADFYSDLSIEAGNYGHYRLDVDVTGAITDDGKLQGRFVGAYLDEDSFLDYAFTKKIVVAPSLKYEFTENTSATLFLQYLTHEYLPSYGFGAQYNGGDPEDPHSYIVPKVPRSRFVAANSDNRDTYKDYIYSRLAVEHVFENEWKLRATGFYTSQDLHMRLSNAGGPDPDGIVGLSIYGREVDNGDTYGGEVNLFGDVELFGQNHTLFLGVDYTYDSSNDGMTYGGIYGQGGEFNVYSPDYSLIPDPRAWRDYPVAPVEEGDPSRDAYLLLVREKGYSYGVTVQTVLRPLDKLQVILGARYSDTEGTDARAFTYGTTNALLDVPPHWSLRTGPESLPDEGGFDSGRVISHVITYQAGVSYRITDSINAYASYAEGFEPRTDRAFNGYDEDGIPNPGTLIGPEESVSYEIGFKGDLFDGMLSWTFDAFEISRTNIAEGNPDPMLGALGFVVLKGKQRSRGLEFDFQGKITKSWDIYASTAYIKNEYTEGDQRGQLSFLAPKIGASLFTNYEFTEGALDGFGIGGGVVYKKLWEVKDYSFAGADQNFSHLFKDPFELDVRAYYKLNEKLRLRASITNLTDSKYYSSINGPFFGLSANPGRQYIVGANYSF